MAFCMHPFWTIAKNTFGELIRQPIFLILMTASSAFIIFLGSVYYFALGEDPKLVKDSALATMLVVGVFGAVFNAASSVAEEIRSGTALAVVSKPVGRAQFLLAKFAGSAGALTLLCAVNLQAVLLASRMGFDVYGEPDYPALALYYGAMLAGFALAGCGNFFLHRPYVRDAVLAQAALLTLAFVAVNFIGKDAAVQPFGKDIDWRMLPAGLLILFALWLFAGLAIALTTRLAVIPTLALCGVFFLLGLMSDYLFGRQAESGSWAASIVYAILPNWQLFWAADALEGAKTVPWRYLAHAFSYVLGYLTALMGLGLILFEEKDLG